MFDIIKPYYDIDLANIYFEDWKTDLEYNNQLLMFSSRNGTDYIVLAENLSEPYYRKSELNKMRKSDLIDLCHNLDVYVSTDFTKKDIIDEIMCVVDIEYYYTKHYENSSWHDLEYDFSVIGYCQGDCFKVNILSDNLKWNTKEYLTNLFYDTPINHGKISFLDREIYLDEYCESLYEWNLDGLVNNFEKSYKGWYKDRIIEIIKNLPRPEY